jgi:hypothetical protein
MPVEFFTTLDQKGEIQQMKIRFKRHEKIRINPKKKNPIHRK